MMAGILVYKKTLPKTYVTLKPSQEPSQQILD